MIVVVTGGRSYSNTRTVFETLDRAHAQEEIELLVHGGATGADFIASMWAEEREIPCVRFPARWSTEGKSAGPKRNGRMLTWANLAGDGKAVLIAFSGGTGTLNCISQAERREMEIHRIPESE